MKGIVSLLVLFILLPASSPAESLKSAQKRSGISVSAKNKKETGVARRQKPVPIKNFLLEFKKEKDKPKEVQMGSMEYQVTVEPRPEPVEMMHGDFVIVIGPSREDQCRQRFSSEEFGEDLVQCCEKGLIDLDSVITRQERNQCCPIIYSGDPELEACCKKFGDEVTMGLDDGAVHSCLATPPSAP